MFNPTRIGRYANQKDFTWFAATAVNIALSSLGVGRVSVIWPRSATDFVWAMGDATYRFYT